MAPRSNQIACPAGASCPRYWISDLRLASYSIGSAFTGAHSHNGFHGADPDFAVTDLASARRLNDAVHDLVDDRVVDDDLDPNLRHEIDRVLGTPVNLGVALLPSVALDFADGHAQDAGLLQAGFDVVEGERFHDRGDQLHTCSASSFSLT